MNLSVSELPGANRLFVDYVENFSRLESFYALDPHSHAAIQHHAERLGQRDYPRHAVAAILEKQNRRWTNNWQTSTLVRQNIAALAEHGSVAVVTGQQVGIFGGPLFTLYKALTCLKFVEKLRADTKRTVVPIFWLAADDDDVAEVNRLTVMSRDNELVPFTCVFDTDERRPVAMVHLTENIENCHRAFNEAIPETEFKNDILGTLRQSYFAGETLPDAFARWLLHLLGDYGLVMLNPADAELKRLSIPLFERELKDTSPSSAAALEMTAQLANVGYASPVSLRPDRLNLFFVDTRRHTLEWRQHQWVSTDGRLQFSRTELLRHLHTHPERFSPNVVLRPLMQDFLLPNAAYIAGPAEIAYFGQLRGVYEAFEVPMPAIVPRQSITLVEKKITRVLEKYGLRIQDFWGGPVEELIGRLVKREAAEELFTPVASTRDELQKRLAELKARAVRLDQTLGGFIDKEQGRIFHQLELIEKKLLQAAKRQNETLIQQIAKAGHALYPNHRLQERELSFVPFLCKYGRGFIHQLYERIDPMDFRHQIVEL
ncbi:MAG: bacillithiol biosynthesis cysteine-adding enzyme BshC [candidate division KSB1 bacterium]|nr:bacillithiol biosynthesis cysteine-adding enzyme BshC [candidate division KSB1 bacterium]